NWGTWSTPTIERITWCLTPARSAPASRVFMEARKKSRDAWSNVGEFARFTTTSAPSSAWSTPFPVITSTPVDGAAGTASCPAAGRFWPTCEPISPVPPMTASFMIFPAQDRSLELLARNRASLLAEAAVGDEPGDGDRREHGVGDPGACECQPGGCR